MNINSANPPLVMVHGWGGSHRETWQKSGVEQLLTESGRTVIGVDLLGHGTAAKPHDPAAYSDISEPIRTAIGARSSTVDAVGFSLGAIALLHAATINPNYFRRLMLVGIGNGVLDEHDPNETKRIVGGIEGTSATDDVLARQFGNYAKKTSNDPSALKAVLLRPRSKPFEPKDLKTISARVSVVIGDRDFVLPADRLIESFENCELTILKNCDHFATPENFGFIDQLLEFFGAE